MSNIKFLRTISLAALIVFLFSFSVSAQELHKMGYEAYKNKEYSKAIQYLKQVTTDFPEWFFGHFWLGRSYQANGNFNEAVSAYKVAVNFADNADDKFKVNYAIAETYYTAKNYSNALKYVKVALSVTNAKHYRNFNKNMALIKGFSEYNTKKYSDCVSTFQPLVSNDSADANVLKTVAKAYQSLNQDSKAVDVIQKVVQLDPADINAHMILIKSRINGGKWRQAIADADYAIRNHPGNWELYSLKGYAEYRSRRYNDAVTSFEKSLEKEDTNEVHKLLGDAYAEIGNYSKAVEHYDKAQAGGDYADDAAFFMKFAYYWWRFVPEDAEKYHGTSRENQYMRALENANRLLDHAATLRNADKTTIDGIKIGVANKRERLEKGQFYTETIKITVDPETGEIRQEKVGSTKEDKDKPGNN